jgi:Ca-activated chloride channel family protein
MIRLAEPLFLLLLLIVPALLFLQNRRRNTILFSRVTLLETLPQSWAQRMQPLLPILYTLALIMLIVALARPQRGLDESKVRTEAVDMILLLDLSESMDTQDFTRANQRISRLDATKDVLNRFLENRPNDRIGIVGFASLPYAVAPLTLDHSWLIERMKSLHTRMLDGRRTAIGDGIASAINRLRESEAKSKVIILLTDGANNAGTLSPENAATAAAALDIKIYTIGAAGVRTGFFANRNEIDEETLMQLAQTTNGRFYRARNLASLEAIYDEIDQLEKTEIEVERYTRYQELAGNWMVAGILLLTIEQLLSTSRLGRLP